MRLVIGGRAQGKLAYVLNTKSKESLEQKVAAGMEIEKMESVTIWNRYQEWFQAKLSVGENPEEWTRDYVRQNSQICIICDEVGSGIVPMDRAEREYRERLGRMLCELASQAESVERVFCGLGQKLK
ncbi:MAG: bifunctional adenosylcobinamide kinase/adenosylcobinamide-phosphate guanylyltransferase [Lachnospiraceae bacterium]